ncbi:conjugal transfer protein TraG N-terminal domain-containing protein [Vibrio parahaemolyticus]|nr:conjugal transfer protein TraG N-terminal domain-containing protein [Vibrio parahaemolyticus]
MIWDIVTFSNTATLNMVMNAIASIFSDGGYKSAAAALMLFVVGAAVLGDMVKGGQELSFHKLLAGFVIYTAGFTTLTSVSIENRFDGTVERIDNIPVAVAVPASLISNMGLWLGETTETAFTPLNYTDIYKVTSAGYMTPLKTLVAYRQTAMDSYCGGGVDKSVVNGINLCKSLSYFVSECTMVKLSEQKAPEQLYEGDFLSTLRFDSKAHATLLFDGNNNSTVYDCQTASDLIINAFNNAQYADYLNSTATIDYAKASSMTLTDVSEDIFSPNVNYQSGQGRAFMTAMFNHQLAEKGQYAFYSRTNAQDIAENLNSSIQQRNYGWALQGEMWYELVDKFMSIMEALIYALAPFIGLMLITGSLGQKTFLLYLQMLAVIQLIPMMLVVTQSVVLHDFNNAFLALSQDKNIEPGSINYAMALTSLAFDKMGIGGMMAATVVPGMAMALVTGSGMALMGAIKGAATTAKDTDAMPETHGQGGATVNLGTRNTASQDQFGNTVTQSAMTEVGKISNSSALTKTVEQAHQKALESSNNYSNALSNVTKSSSGQTYDSSAMREMGTSVSQSTNDTKAWSEQLSQQIQKQYGIGETQASNIVGSFALQAFAGKGLKFGAEGAEKFTTGLSKEEKEIYADMTTGQSSKQFQSSLQEGQSIIDKNSEKISTQNSTMDERARKVDSAYQEKESSRHSYNEAVTAKNELSLSNDDLMTNMRMKAHSDGTESRMNRMVQDLKENNPEAYAMFARKYDEYDGGVNANNVDDKTAKLMALAATSNAFSMNDDFVSNVWSMDKPTDNTQTIGTHQQLIEPSKILSKTQADVQGSDQWDSKTNDLRKNHTMQSDPFDNEKFKEFKEHVIGKDVLDGNSAYQLYRALNNTDSGGEVLKQHDRLMQYLESEGYYEPSKTSAESAMKDFFSDVGKEAKGILVDIGVLDKEPEQKPNTNKPDFTGPIPL